MDAVGPSTPRRRHRSGLRSRQARSEQQQAERAASQRDAPAITASATPTGQRTVSGPRFPIGLCGATTAHNNNVNTTMRRVPLGRHVFVARDPSALAGDESSLGSNDAPPPANLHGYAEWDFSNDPANAVGSVGAGDGEITPAPGIATRLAPGPSAPAGADADAQLA
jgi:hypothetical protein